MVSQISALAKGTDDATWDLIKGMITLTLTLTEFNNKRKTKTKKTQRFVISSLVFVFVATQLRFVVAMPRFVA